MNYLRGAVSAISAPYQYYKDLNPATLTGAIDVIVVRRPRQQDGQSNNAHPAEDGHELVCSPFHVRFGKWQVLRPGDKKVNMFVNGNQVPFPMKIGEAGEAFFIFETDEDVPDSLVTSPLLEATQPGQTNADVQRAGRFGAKEGSEKQPEEPGAETQEPEFLDLNAPEPQEDLSLHAEHQRFEDAEGKASLLTQTAQLGKAIVGATVEAGKSESDKLKDETLTEAVTEVEKDKETFLREKALAAHNAAKHPVDSFRSNKGDEVLPDTDNVEGPDVVYTDDLAHCAGTPSPPVNAPIPFPTMRATSEPPFEHPTGMTPPLAALTPPTTPPTRSPSMSRMHATKAKVGPHATIPVRRAQPETEEYMWEWGNFPQRTPVRTTFPSMDGLNPSRKGKERMSDLILDPNVSGKEREGEMVSSPVSMEEEGKDELTFGKGGRLAIDRRNPTRFRVSIERRVVDFELSIVSGAGRRDRQSGKGPLGGEDEVVDMQHFEEGRVDFERFINDDKVISDQDLVLRWAGDMYITRQDGSPLMDALVLWRDAALRGKLARSPSRSPSLSWEERRSRLKNIDEEVPYASDEEPLHMDRTKSDMSGSTVTEKTPPPSSSSWVRWWSRSRNEEPTQRPNFKSMNTAPSTVQRSDTQALQRGPSPTKRSSSVTPISVPLRSTERGMPGSPSSDTSSEDDQPKRYAKTLRLTSEQLKSLDLKPGANSITFSLSATGAAACTARLFVWEHTDQVVISDIDGTITKSDALGHVFTMIGRDWTHLGVAKLYTDICRNGYKILYLTSRAIGQADSTRDYLKGVKQNDYQLPEGPVIMSPDRLLTSLHREVIMRKPEVFKMAALRDIQKLFGTTAKNPFYAGFGNRITDALSYRSVGVPSSRIFTIDSNSEVRMELLELAGYKSSYIHMTDLVDQMFPPINRTWAAEFTDFNYWKQPMQDFPLPDLTPPSPALSARSDTSNQSTLARLRHFSLMGGRQTNNMDRFTLPPPATRATDKDATAQERRNETHLRQMSSFERLSSTLSALAQSASPISSPRSSTPTFIDSGSEDEGDEPDVEKQKRRRRRRESMPGSLPGSDGSGSDEDIHFGVDDAGDGAYDGEREVEAAEEAFDEDFLAAGEMEKVPFL
ncbi:hypothetical protein EVJ58_g2591 [Rhodofomes roseus]|uniref:phosphatidate phosphatase n=1 Tax=Rhodofomes roseus TaxID=34475 RepID=A0A4Y9YPY6_9APHY|nr:hypothetical protein EVJ58_g2591 [Rhodofomes roseus]